jgi:methionyl-tRNA formyltransferase
MRIAFAGTPAFAAVALQHLIDAGFDVALVLTQPDRPAGRGRQVQASPVKRIAQTHGIAVAQPQGLKLDGRYAADAQAARDALLRTHVDAMVVVAYGLILPAWVLGAPRLGCVNIHASLLPRWRGAAPIQRAIEAGDARTGITIIRMDEGLDTGAMLAHEAVDIGADDTSGTLHDRLAPVGARLVAGVLVRMQVQGDAIAATAQPAHGVTYAAKIAKDEAAIDWARPADEIERRARAFDPSPGCTFVHDGQVVKLWRARVVDADDARAAPADAGRIEVSGQRVVVGCGRGALELVDLQRPGGRRVTGAQYAQGIAAHGR